MIIALLLCLPISVIIIIILYSLYKQQQTETDYYYTQYHTILKENLVLKRKVINKDE